MKFTAIAISALVAVASASPFASPFHNTTSTSVAPISTVTPMIPYVPTNTTSVALPAKTVAAVTPATQLGNGANINLMFCDDIVACIEELATVVSACAAAVVAGCADVVQDVKCLVDAAEMISKVPKACKNCLHI